LHSAAAAAAYSAIGGCWLQAHGKAQEWFINAFIDREHDMMADDVYAAILSTCQQAKSAITGSFRSPHPVLLAFVQRIVTRVLKQIHVVEDLRASQATGDFLIVLHTLFCQSRDIVQQLAELFADGPGTEKTFEAQLMHAVFGEVLAQHLDIEVESLTIT